LFFYENFFPFSSLYANVGALLSQEILLVPSHLSPKSTHNGDAQIDDHMNFPKILVVTPLRDHAAQK
jgi:hypothetical protein